MHDKKNPDVQQIVKDYAETFTALKEHDEAGEEWIKELEEQDWYETFTQTWQEDQCKGFIQRILSQREARVRGETIAECVACVPEEMNHQCHEDAGETWCASTAEAEGFNDCRQKTLQALQSLSPNQK